MAAGGTYEPIATTTLSSATNSVNFTSIPGTYTDLVLIGDFACSVNGANGGIYFNSSTGSVSQTSLYGSSTTAGSYRITGASNIFFGAGGDIANNRQSIVVNIQNYSNSTTNKTCLIRYNTVSNAVMAVVGMRNNTDAITAVNLTTQAGNYNSGSIFTLYGIAAA
jgi:hypothetical protein